MKKVLKRPFLPGRTDPFRRSSGDMLLEASRRDEKELMDFFGTGPGGLTPEAAAASAKNWGANQIHAAKKESAARRLFGSFINPFTIVLLLLAAVSAVTDIAAAAPGSENYTTVGIITAMVLISGLLRFVQETKSGNAASRLAAMIHTTACVEREGTGLQEIPMEEIVAGDLIYLSAGDMIPADVRILQARDLFVSQSALTGESEPSEKFSHICDKASPAELDNMAFLGTNVVSGSGKALVIGVGSSTLLGTMAADLNRKPVKTAFEKGVSSVSWLLIRFMLVMVPVVLFLNGFTKGDWMEAVLFAVSVAVGLTPEMLPMIVTACLAKGAVAMSHKKVIIKSLDSIQNLGSMDILCTDKTGTLTQDRVVLEYHLNMDGEEDPRVLRHAFLNSYFQTGLKSLMDVSVIARQEEAGAEELIKNYRKVDEIPFDFGRRRMSVVVSDLSGKTQLITKGAVEEMLSCCAFAESGGNVLPLTEELREKVLARSRELNGRGMRVLAVAQKTDPSPVGAFSVSDESGMVLMGFLAFLDPPKETTAAALRALKAHGISVKILTGDNEKVTLAICRQVGLEVNQVLLGSQTEELDDAELTRLAETVTVFAKLSPSQKARIVRLLREAGHCVGYMGDGINDAAAMKASDIGISVDTAVDIAKEAADAILLEKDLMVLEEGVLEGRKTYGNMIKYIKITASSNFGNMFSVLAAGIFLPFLPMTALHLLLLNLIYDISCAALPWDRVDEEFLREPKSWSAASISRFMVRIGPISSLFDIGTFLLLYFLICPGAMGGQSFGQLSPEGRQAFICLFQTGWFVESMWSQALSVHTLRTPKLFFPGSPADKKVLLLTVSGMAAALAIPFTPLGSAMGFSALPAVYFAWLPAVLAGYILAAAAVKRHYIRRFGEWL